MRRRSDRKKTPDVPSSPAPARRSSRRSRRTASPSPEKSDNESGVEQDVAQAPKTRRRSSVTPSKESGPSKKNRLELNKIVEENGDGNADDNKTDEEVEKSIEQKDKTPEEKVEPKVTEESDINEKKVRQTDKHLDDKEQSTELETTKESKESREKDEKSSPSKREKRSKEREKSSEKSHKKDKDVKSRKSVESEEPSQKEEEVDATVSQNICSSTVETNGEKVNESSEKVQSPVKETAAEVTVASSTVPEPSSEDKQKTVKKRKWGSRKSSENKIMAISTDSLKSLISDPVHPVPLSDVHLDSSPEIEMVQSENETNLEDIGKKDREIIQKSIKTSPEKNKTSKEELEEGEDDSEEEEGQIEKGKTSVKTNSSSILYITNLVRPFTIMQLKGLLARTGKIVDNGFWIDRIKSKCYVKFENEE